MGVTVGGTSITFNDATVQTTAATAVSTAFGAVGTYAALMNAANSNVAIGGTVAGSSLRYDYTASGAATFYSNALQGVRARINNSNYDGGGTAVSGTWRRMSSGNIYASITDPCNYTTYYWSVALYVRIS